MSQEIGNLTFRTGEEFEIRLTATASTGFIWRLGPIPEQVETLGSSFVQAGQDPPAPGGPSTQVFRFRAVHPGQAELTFELKRSWERTPAQTHVVNVTVTG
ncbi:MAG TPA: protease inhibitor I42 family protein [Anaerolineaceae bacterium]|nr:protease inhibitor I42 family protein [Anaerolineaceae bacterium]